MSLLSLTAEFDSAQIADLASINGWSPKTSRIELVETEVDGVTHPVPTEIVEDNPQTAEDFIKIQLEKMLKDYIISSFGRIKQKEIDELVAQHNSVVESMISEQITISIE